MNLARQGRNQNESSLSFALRNDKLRIPDTVEKTEGRGEGGRFGSPHFHEPANPRRGVLRLPQEIALLNPGER
jgi:hypothetical protein